MDRDDPGSGFSSVGYWQGEELELGKRYTYRPRFVPLLLDHLGIGPGSSILEIGAGTGFLGRLLARTLSDVRVTGLEPDAGLRALAREGVQREGLGDRISFVAGNAYALPFGDGEFDHVTSHTVMCIIGDPARALREQFRVTRRGGGVSAVVCFCHTGGLPHYHGRYPLPGNHRIDELADRLQRVYTRTVRPRLIEADHGIVNQDLLWEFRNAGLTDVRIDGHLMLFSPGDERLPPAEGAAYAVGMHRIALRRLEHWRDRYADDLAAAGFAHHEFDELLALKRARLDYLQVDPERVREVMEVFTDPLIVVRGTRP